MKLTLNLENDAELRSAVREMVRGEVKNIVRTELRAIVTAEAEGNAQKYSTPEYVKALIDRTIVEMVKKVVQPGGLYRYGGQRSAERGYPLD